MKAVLGFFDFGGGSRLTVDGKNIADLKADDFSSNGNLFAGQAPPKVPDAFAAEDVDVFDIDALL
ncbi:hypothetical protein N9M10_04515 [Hellea sp.]|nr:hypothetical protein [Hellea sp.]